MSVILSVILISNLDIHGARMLDTSRFQIAEARIDVSLKQDAFKSQTCSTLLILRETREVEHMIDLLKKEEDGEGFALGHVKFLMPLL